MNIFQKYNHVLEYIPKENICIQTITNESLIQDLLHFLQKYNLTNILISLSGGVDSMVLFDLLNHIKQNDLHQLNIYVCHIFRGCP